ncbi:DUF484 family protein [Marinomonas sp. A79]|uniref:DUF484 family protein n=1 Tax=Marinomonas vulgaris TaxID=2823372 RepID=A0ABS5HET9_9GAMM|nr:DUF484 family protein [Marinomonas vulgaris]MBR7889995.1 DUF484 family protein [Marinomonas vulgaris]
MSEEEIVQYLSNTPDFFTRHADLLESMTLPHPVSGNVISLLEYQVTTLRQSTSAYRSQFERLVEVARENELTMQKSRRLVLAGLTCSTLDDLAVVISDMVRDDFDASFHAFVLYDHAYDSAVRVHHRTEDHDALARVIQHDDCYCGRLSDTEMQYLFAENASAVNSVAVLPLVSREGGDIQKYGVLVLGASTEHAFDQEKGTLFLQYLADLLSAILLRLIP